MSAGADVSADVGAEAVPHQDAHTHTHSHTQPQPSDTREGGPADEPSRAVVAGRAAQAAPSPLSSDAFSRLYALERMGIVADYGKIRNVTVGLIGVGGVGAVAAEMLARAGVGRIIIFDCDTIELANMNRMLFRLEHVGRYKAEVAAELLRGMSTSVDVQAHVMDIAAAENYAAFTDIVATGNAITGGPVDLVLSCVDNYAARVVINRVALAHAVPWMNSGVSEDAVSAHVQVMIPGATACFECVPPLAVASGMDERAIRRDAVCAASLPTTMGITAGLLVQNALKHILQFGDIAYYQSYSALTNFVPNDVLRPNPACTSALCRQQQQQVTAAGGWVPRVSTRTDGGGDSVVHESNEWEIRVPDGEERGAAPVLREDQQAPQPSQLEANAPTLLAASQSSPCHAPTVEPSLVDLETELAQLCAQDGE